MRIQQLEFHSPDSLSSASRLMHSLGSNARLMAGGTDLLADLKQDLVTAGNLVSLARIPGLGNIELKEDGLRIGPLVTPNMLAESELLQRNFPGLSDAAASMAGMQIRNLATIGGNLCSAVPSADLPPALLVAGASLHLVSESGERILPVREFLLGVRQTSIAADEILAGISVPLFPACTGTAYEKYQLRAASALAVVGAGARLTVEDNTIRAGVVAITAAAPAPLVIDTITEYLGGKEPVPEVFVRAGELASEGIKPISDLRGSAEYRRQLAAVLTVRALQRAYNRIQSQEPLSC